MIRRPPRSTPKPSSAASDVYKRQGETPAAGSLTSCERSLMAAMSLRECGSADKSDPSCRNSHGSNQEDHLKLQARLHTRDARHLPNYRRAASGLQRQSSRRPPRGCGRGGRWGRVLLWALQCCHRVGCWRRIECLHAPRISTNPRSEPLCMLARAVVCVCGLHDRPCGHAI